MSIRSLTNAIVLFVLQEVSATASLPHFYSLVGSFENLLLPGTSAEACGYLWVSERKGAFQMSHSKTVGPCVKIRLYLAGYGSKQSSLATDKTD